MATFAYVGKTRQGGVKKGEVSAKTRDEAVEQLRKLNVAVSSLQEKTLAGGVLSKFGAGGNSNFTWRCRSAIRIHSLQT